MTWTLLVFLMMKGDFPHTEKIVGFGSEQECKAAGDAALLAWKGDGNKVTFTCRKEVKTK